MSPQQTAREPNQTMVCLGMLEVRKCFTMPSTRVSRFVAQWPRCSVQVRQCALSQIILQGDNCSRRCCDCSVPSDAH